MKLPRDGCLDAFADFDEAGECGISAGRVMRLASKQQLAVMLGEHDHYRIDAREMFRRAVLAATRPAAAHDPGHRTAVGAEPIARVPAREAERRGDQRG